MKLIFHYPNGTKYTYSGFTQEEIDRIIIDVVEHCVASGGLIPDWEIVSK